MQGVTNLRLPRRMAIEHLRSLDWVLLPGTLCTEQVFTEFLDELKIPAARRKPVRLEFPAVDDYAEILHPLAANAVLCGFSLGAIVAAHHSDLLRAKRIILFAVNPFADDPAKAEGRRELERDVVEHGTAEALAARLPVLNGPSPDRARAAILSMAGEAAPDIEAQTSLAMTRPGALNALGRCRIPLMVLTGTRDEMAPVALGRAAADAAPSGRFGALPNLGHYALVEDPKRCAQVLLDLEDRMG